MELDTVGQRRAWQQVIPGSVSILLAIGTSVPSKKSRNKKLGKAHEKRPGKGDQQGGRVAIVRSGGQAQKHAPAQETRRPQTIGAKADAVPAEVIVSSAFTRPQLRTLAATSK